jgi:DNA polymerase-3 subunit epsilon
MKILFFDTETTGTPVLQSAPATNVNNSPRIIQLAFTVTDKSGAVLSSVNKLIKPNGWTMPTGQFWVENGFSQEKNEAEGEEIVDILRLLTAAIFEASILVAHNMAYDRRIVCSEYYRAGINPNVFWKKEVCTMQTSRNICKLKQARGGYKAPKLQELHQFLFDGPFTGAHDADQDVAATKACFFELVKRGHINL